MAEQKLNQKVPIPKDPNNRNVHRSVLEFSTDTDDEELFLLFSSGMDNGPGINRDGKSSPWMTHPNPKYLGKVTTDPDIQRYGTYFLDEEVRNVDVSKLKKRITELTQNNGNEQLIHELEELLASNIKQKTYLGEFKEHYPEYDVVGVQGIGDLTMNLWNVAYINDRITKEPKFLHLFDEPIPNREYTCLVKWKDGRFPKLQIKRLRFDRYIYNLEKTHKAVVQLDGEPIAHLIEFAVYGQLLIKPKYNDPSRSEIFHPRDNIHQFSDIRHIFQLPNLNPNDGDQPRIYFGKEQHDDVWLGEAEIISSRNLRRAAIADAVELNTLYSGLGVPGNVVKDFLEKAGYSEANNISERLRYEKISPAQDYPNTQNIAEWRFVPEDSRLVEIRIRENRYPCTLVGINNNGRLYMLAWKGVYSKYPGWTLRQAASHFLEYDVEAAILCDEGADVFQYVKTPDTNKRLAPVIKPSRGQIRAVFVVAKKKKPVDSKENA